MEKLSIGKFVDKSQATQGRDRVLPPTPYFKKGSLLKKPKKAKKSLFKKVMFF